MAIQTATTGELEHAQRIIIAKILIATEHNQPCVNLCRRIRLGKGGKSVTVPRVGQVNAQSLTDGVDLVASSDISMDYENASPDEVGLKFVITDKLARQLNEDVFSLIGQQLGNAMARKRDEDVIALFVGLSRTVGADNATLHMTNAAGALAYAVANKFPKPVVMVHHPNALMALSRSAQAIASTTGLTPIEAMGKQGFQAELLKDFLAIVLNGVPFFHDGNIEKYGGNDSGYGALLGAGCLGFVESKEPYVERERDASLRGTEVVMVSDYKAFEINDDWGAKALYEIGALTHDSTA